MIKLFCNLRCVCVCVCQVNFDDADWYRNAAGLSHSHKHGFGMMDAWRLVTAARVCIFSVS